ncbi:hypothetical protein F5Y03DRAFT_360363 [Xylaria venustula]|nr:hypothetical protein F5Y03DRAFT_360363 [Xylaria venustula]
MAEAIGIAAAALQFLGTTKACLSAFQDFQQNTPEAHRVLKLRLETEAMRFREWCELFDIQATATTEAGDIEALQERLHHLLRFDNENVAALIVNAIKDMERIFKKAREKFSPIEDDDRKLLSIAQKPSVKRERQRFFTRVFHSRNKSIRQSGEKTAIGVSESSPSLRSRASSVYLGAKWLALDKKAFTSMLDDITAVNNCLNTFLSESSRATIRRRVQADLLQNNQLETLSVKDGLPNFTEIERLAKIKEEVQTEKLIEDKESYEPSGNAGDKAPNIFLARPGVFEITAFSGGPLSLGPPRSVSSLTGRPVIIEWTHCRTNINLDHIYRRGNILQLLNDSNMFRKFNTLPSRGVVIDSKNDRIGLVFQIPSALQGPIQEKTLLDLIDSTPYPVGQRFLLARALSVAVHNLQLVGWLHKSIRCDNIIFFDNSQPRKLENSNDRMEVNGPVNNKHGLLEFSMPNRLPRDQVQTALKLPDLYLLGWNLSRPDAPGESSQSIPTKEYQFKQVMSKLSSHPDLLAEGDDKRIPRFRLEYDIYSFGLVLLQIGLWRSLTFIRDRERYASDDEFHRLITGVYCDRLLSSMGEIYWRATKRCLDNDFNVVETESSSTGAQSYHAKLSTAFEKEVVSKLEGCHA